MLTKKSYKFLGQHYFVSSVFCVLPFSWDSKSCTLTTCKSKFRLAIYYVNALMSTVMAGWLCRCFILGLMSNGDRHISKLVVDIIFVLPYVAQLFWQIATIFMQKEFANLISQLLRFDRNYTKRYCEVSTVIMVAPKLDAQERSSESGSGQEQKPELTQSMADIRMSLKAIEKTAKEAPEESDGCDANIFMSLYMLFVYSALAASLFLKNPHNERYMYGAIMDSLGVSRVEQRSHYFIYVWTVMEYFQLMKFCLLFNNIFYIILLYAHSTNFWLQYLSFAEAKKRSASSRGGKTNKNGLKQVLRVNEAIRNYKAAQVLNVLFNECCAWIVIPIFKCLNISLHVMATFVTISFHSDIPIGGFLIFPIGFVMWCGIEKDVYPLLGRIDESSRNYMDSWKSLGSKNYSRHFKALFPLGVKVSNCYSINKSTVLAVWSTIFNLVINCIVL